MLYYTICQRYLSAYTGSTQRRCCTTLFVKDTSQISLEAHRDVVLHYLSKLPVSFHWKHTEEMLYYTICQVTCQLTLEAHRGDVVLHYLSKLPVSLHWKHTDKMLYYTICQSYQSAFSGSTQRRCCTTLFVKVTCQLSLEAHREDVVLHYLSKIPVNLYWMHTDEILYYTICQSYMSAYTGSTQRRCCTTLFVKVTSQLSVEAHREDVVLHYLSKIHVSFHWKHTEKMLYYTICQSYLSTYTGCTQTRYCTTLFVKITCQLLLEAHREDVVLHYLSKLPVSFQWKHTEKMLYYTICQSYLSALTGSTQRRCCTTLFVKDTCQLTLEAHKYVVLH